MRLTSDRQRSGKPQRLLLGGGPGSRPTRRASLLTWLLLLFISTTSHLDAQWTGRTVELDAGWNTLWLDVEPSVNAVEAFLDGLDWESIWAQERNPREGSGRWILNARGRPRFLQSLHRVCANRAYLVRMRSGGALRFVGRPTGSRASLERERHVLLGVGVDGQNRPGFDEFLSHPNVAGKVEAVHGIVNGEVRRLALGDRIEPSRAYWFFAKLDVPRLEPIRVSAGPLGVDFGRARVATTLDLEVPERPFPSIVLLRAVPTVEPPAGQPADAAAGGLGWLEFRDADGDFRTLEETTSVDVPAGTTRLPIELRAVRGLSPSPADGGGGGLAGGPPPENQAVLEISDLDGNRVELGVTAGFPTVEGLWVGTLNADRVSVHADHGGSAEARPTSVFTAALILEVPASGPPRLLSEASIPIDRDGRETTQRLRALLFPEPVELEGEIEDGGTSGTLTGVMILASDHPLSPHRHRYHVEHREGFELGRQFVLTFERGEEGAEIDEDVAPLLDSGTLQGTWDETLLGLLPEPIRIGGTFRLRRIADQDGAEEAR